jgi:hypothetical protein
MSGPFVTHRKGSVVAKTASPDNLIVVSFADDSNAYASLTQLTKPTLKAAIRREDTQSGGTAEPIEPVALTPIANALQLADPAEPDPRTADGAPTSDLSGSGGDTLDLAPRGLAISPTLHA